MRKGSDKITLCEGEIIDDVVGADDRKSLGFDQCDQEAQDMIIPLPHSRRQIRKQSRRKRIKLGRIKPGALHGPRHDHMGHTARAQCIKHGPQSFNTVNGDGLRHGMFHTLETDRKTVGFKILDQTRQYARAREYGKALCHLSEASKTTDHWPP